MTKLLHPYLDFERITRSSFYAKSINCSTCYIKFKAHLVATVDYHESRVCEASN